MLEDMAMRGLREDTQRDYIRFVRNLAAFLQRSPDTATAEDVRRLNRLKLSTQDSPTQLSAIRFRGRECMARRKVAGPRRCRRLLPPCWRI